MVKRQILRGQIEWRPGLLLALFISPLLVGNLSCKHEKTMDTNTDTPAEITWRQTALDSLKIFSLAAHPSIGVLAGSCAAPIYRSVDHGNSWIPRVPACSRAIAINRSGDVFWTGGAVVRRSTDTCESWISLYSGFSSVDLKAIAFNQQGNIFVSSLTSDESRGGIYRSADNGDTWIKTSFPDSIGPWVLAINSNGDIFAGTGFGVFRSVDDGTTWMQLNIGFRDLGLNYFVSALAIDSANGNIFAALEDDGVYRSTNNGNTWGLTGLTNPTIEALIINEKGHIFAGSKSNFPVDPAGVFYSIDKGENWAQINSGLTNIDVLALTIDPAGYVYAGTHGSGVFRTVESTNE